MPEAFRVCQRPLGRSIYCHQTLKQIRDEQTDGWSVDKKKKTDGRLDNRLDEKSHVPPSKLRTGPNKESMLLTMQF